MPARCSSCGNSRYVVFGLAFVLLFSVVVNIYYYTKADSITSTLDNLEVLENRTSSALDFLQINQIKDGIDEMTYLAREQGTRANELQDILSFGSPLTNTLPQLKKK